LYALFKDTNGLRVKKLNGITWEAVGTGNINDGYLVGVGSLAISSQNVLYVPYWEETSGLRVKKFNGTTWEIVGDTIANSTNGVVAIDSNNIPYIVYSDSLNGSKATVKKFNGTAWETVGSAGFSTNNINFFDIKFDSNNIPYVAYREYLNANKATVQKFNGTAWEIVGSEGFSETASDYLSLALDQTNNPYIMYTDNSGTSRRTIVEKLENSGKILKGSPTTAGTFDVNLTVTDGTNSVDHSFQITAVTEVAPTISSTPVTTASLNQPYSYSLVATDGNNDTLTWSVKSGTTLPSWITFDNNVTAPKISGTPTTAGNYDVNLTVTDGTNVIPHNFTISVFGSAQTLPVQKAPAGETYSYDLSQDFTGYTIATFDGAPLPEGLTLTGTTLSGTPTTGGDVTIKLVATDTSGNKKLITFDLKFSLAPTITSTPIITVAKEAEYSYSPIATDADGDQMTFTGVTIPSWLTFSSITQEPVITYGALSGINDIMVTNNTKYVASEEGLYTIDSSGTITKRVSESLGFYRVILDNNGDLYATTYGKVIKINPTDFTTTNVYTSSVDTHYGLAKDSQGNIYVGYHNGSSGYVIGKIVSGSLSIFPSNNSTIPYLKDITVDSSDNVYALTKTALIKYSSNGTQLASLTGLSIGDYGTVTIANDGKIYVSNSTTNTISLVSSDLSTISTVAVLSQNPSAYATIKAVTSDSDGDLYSVEHNVINKVTLDTNILKGIAPNTDGVYPVSIKVSDGVNEILHDFNITVGATTSGGTDNNTSTGGSTDTNTTTPTDNNTSTGGNTDTNTGGGDTTTPTTPTSPEVDTDALKEKFTTTTPVVVDDAKLQVSKALQGLVIASNLSWTTENLTLPTAVSGTTATITWTSSRPSVIGTYGAVTNGGVVTRGTADTYVILTATITSGSEVAKKPFTVFVPKTLATTTEQTKTIIEQIKIADAIGTTQSATAIVDDINVTAWTSNTPSGFTTTITSDKPTIISNTGDVTRGSEDEVVTFTIKTVDENDSTKYTEKTITVLVKKAVSTDEAKLEEAKEILSPTIIAKDNLNLNDITKDLTLPATLPGGATIVWTSSNEDVIAEDGTVTPTGSDTIVTLKATITVNGVETIKEFVVKVPAVGNDVATKMAESKTTTATLDTKNDTTTGTTNPTRTSTLGFTVGAGTVEQKVDIKTDIFTSDISTGTSGEVITVVAPKPTSPTTKIQEIKVIQNPNGTSTSNVTLKDDEGNSKTTSFNFTPTNVNQEFKDDGSVEINIIPDVTTTNQKSKILVAPSGTITNSILNDSNQVIVSSTSQIKDANLFVSGDGDVTIETVVPTTVTIKNGTTTDTVDTTASISTKSSSSGLSSTTKIGTIELKSSADVATGETLSQNITSGGNVEITATTTGGKGKKIVTTPQATTIHTVTTADGNTTATFDTAGLNITSNITSDNITTKVDTNETQAAGTTTMVGDELFEAVIITNTDGTTETKFRITDTTKAENDPTKYRYVDSTVNSTTPLPQGTDSTVKLVGGKLVIENKQTTKGKTTIKIGAANGN